MMSPRPSSHRRLLGGAAALVCLAAQGACVVSTHGGVGAPPEVALPDEPEPAPADLGPESIEARHILISYRGAQRAQPTTARDKSEARALAEQLKQRALGGEDFAQLALEHSDDPGSGAEGGNLGRFTRAQMVPTFSDAAFSLKPGEISEVVESPFGFHIIQRTQ